MFCGRCGNKFSRTDIVFCTQCGTKVPTATPQRASVVNYKNTVVKNETDGRSKKGRIYLATGIAALLVVVGVTTAVLSDNSNIAGIGSNMQLDGTGSSVVVRNESIFAIDNNGSLFAWGSNHSGQLGFEVDNYDVVSYTWGSNRPEQLIIDRGIFIRTPAKVLDNVADVIAGETHTFAITNRGRLYAWGSNRYGQLGDGTTQGSSAPIRIMDNVMSAAIGDGMWSTNRSYAVTQDGGLYAWGSNQEGILGDGTTIDRHIPVRIMNNVISVKADDSHAFAITRDGGLYAWGINDGRLGDGTTENQLSPVRVLDDVIAVELGGHLLGAGNRRTFALTNYGGLYAWGSNFDMQLGVGRSYGNYHSPVRILDNVIDFAAGERHANAVTSDGGLYAWGSIGWIEDIRDREQPSPVRILENAEAVNIISSSNTIMGGGGTFVISRDGGLYTWIADDLGRMRTTRMLSGIVDIVGDRSRVFALSGDGGLYVWGDNWERLLHDSVTDQWNNWVHWPIRILENVRVRESITRYDIFNLQAALISNDSISSENVLPARATDNSTSDDGRVNNLGNHLELPTDGYITIQGIQFCTSLYSLHLNDWDISGLTDADIVPLQFMTNLTILSLGNNNFRDVTPLSGLTNLRHLRLNHNNISDLSPLSGLVNLESLDLTNNTWESHQPLDLTPLSEMTGLITLELSMNRIRDISPLSGLTNLRRLILRANNISDLTPLSGLTNLERLELGGNDSIHDLTPLAGFSSDMYLSLYGNRITDWSPVSHITEVRGRP